MEKASALLVELGFQELLCKAWLRGRNIVQEGGPEQGRVAQSRQVAQCRGRWLSAGAGGPAQGRVAQCRLLLEEQFQ